MQMMLDLMITAFVEACEYAKYNEIVNKIGIHLNLTEGLPLTEGIRSRTNFCGKDGQFHGHINRFRPLNLIEKKSIFDELSAQVEMMRNAGLPITHADSHHHIHTAIFILPVILEVLNKYDIRKIRIHRNTGQINIIKRLIKYLFNYYLINNKFITVTLMGGFQDISTIRVNSDMVVELMVHPDYSNEGILIDNVGYDMNLKNITLQEEFEMMKTFRICSYSDL